MPDQQHIVVLGAGVAGLAAAYRLHQLGHDVTVFEASDAVGGVVQSARRDGFLIEYGPNSIQPSVPELEALVDDLGLTRVPANDAANNRFVVRDGTPHALPMSPPALLKSSLFTLRGKLRLLREPFVAPTVADESVADFVRRRLGDEVLDYAVAPFVSGIYAGDAEALSLRLAFPRLHALEAEHGSLLRGLLRKKKASDTDAPRPPLYTFADGLGALPHALADRLGDTVRLDTPVTGLRRATRGWRVTTTAGTDRFDAVVSALPLHRLAQLDTDLDTAPLADAPHASIAVLHLGVDRRHVAHPLDGFGMLVPPVEDRDILGVLFNATLFPGRAPDGYALLTVFLGGTRRPDVVDLNDDALFRLARRDLTALLGLTGDPVFRHVVRWRRAIPQYTRAFDRVREHLATLEAARPDLAFAGNYRAGVSVGDAVRSGLAADRLSG